MWFALWVGFALKSTVVFAGALLMTKLLRRSSAATRHLVWTAAAAAVLMLPLLSLFLPALRIPTSAFERAAAPLVATAVTTAVPAAIGIHGPATRASAAAGTMTAPADWRWAVMLVWAAGVVLFLLQAVAASIALARLRRSAAPFRDRVLLAAVLQRLGIDSSVDVRESPGGQMPLASGILRPVVLIPASASKWTEETRTMVLLHELAHVRRGDAAAHLLTRMALMLCWWNPLAWKAWHESVKERERAADDLVLNAGVPACAYADRLLDIARGTRYGRLSACAAVPMARRSQLEGRLLAILDLRVNRSAATRASVAAAALVAVAAVLPLAAVHAQNGWSAQDSLPSDIETFRRTAVERRDAAGLENAARTAVNLRNYDAAQKLLQAAADVESQLAGPQSTEYAVDLLRLARLSEKDQDRTNAVTLYSRAVQMLGNKPQAAPALFYLGSVALTKKDYSTAIGDFERARAADPAATGVALMWIAVAHQQQGDTDQAAAFYRDALAHQSSDSREALTTMLLFADFLKAHGDSGEAADIENRIESARRSLEDEAHALPARPDVYSVRSQGVEKPKLLEKVDPNYTDEARAAKLQGTEVLNVVIGTDGTVHDARIVSGIGLGLDDNGIDAVSKWRFEPGTKDGQPVAVMATIEINFRLL